MTQNRRAKISPYVQPGSIDPNLGLIRVDDMNNNPIATLWNFAMHGVCYGPENMMTSGDIMGKHILPSLPSVLFLLTSMKMFDILGVSLMGRGYI